MLTYILSSIALLCIGLGVWQRFHRKRHITLMASAFTLDVIVLLLVEFQRHAVEKLIAQEVSGLTIFHATISAIMIVLYLVMGYLGYGIIQHKPEARKWHRTVGIAFVCFRLTNYVTSFMV